MLPQTFYKINEKYDKNKKTELCIMVTSKNNKVKNKQNKQKAKSAGDVAQW